MHRHVLELHVGSRHRAARKCLARGDLIGRERVGLVDAVVDAPVEDRAFANTAAAIAAIERERDLLPQCGFEQRFSLASGNDSIVRMHEQVELAFAAAALRRKPRQQCKQQRRAPDEQPHVAHRPFVEEGKDRQVEPVDPERRRDGVEVGGALAHRRLHERKHEQCGTEKRHDRPRRIGFRTRDALRMDPQQREQSEREADVQERQQREQPVVHRAFEDEIADERAVEHGQPVQPFRRRDGDELREAIPRQHVAVDAADVGDPQHGDARDPREPAKAPVAIEHEVPQEVQNHAEDHPIGCVAMEAPHDAAQVPLRMRQVLDRRVRFVDTGLEEYEQVEPGCNRDPEQEVGDRTEVVEWIARLAECVVERPLDVQEGPLASALDDPQHSGRRVLASVAEIARRRPESSAPPPGGGNASMQSMLGALSRRRHDLDQPVGHVPAREGAGRR